MAENDDILSSLEPFQEGIITADNQDVIMKLHKVLLEHGQF